MLVVAAKRLVNSGAVKLTINGEKEVEVEWFQLTSSDQMNEIIEESHEKKILGVGFVWFFTVM